jgi:hypothetical protein
MILKTSSLPAVAAGAVVALGALGYGLWLLPATHSRLWLLFGFVLAIGAHAAVGRALKAIVSSVTPLASGAPEASGYQRSIYGTPGPATSQIVGIVLAAGLLLGLGITLGNGWVGSAGLLALVVAIGLDLQRWERVAASADWVWFQRGFGQKVHQVAIENIRDISVQEDDAPGFTLRHGSRNRVCRLNLRMNDKRIVALPKTDAHVDLDAVETVANHIRSRQELMQELASRRPGGGARAGTPRAPDPDSVPPVDTPADDADKEMQRALRRLRRQAASAQPAAAPRDETRRPPKS